jgi:uncharacterized protein YlxP (DUF503 family)
MSGTSRTSACARRGARPPTDIARAATRVCRESRFSRWLRAGSIEHQEETAMVIGVVTASISIPEARSLKDKRSVIRGMKDRALNKMNVSVAEVDKQDMWNYADMAFVTVAATSEIVQNRISEISQFLRSDPRYVLLTIRTEML